MRVVSVVVIIVECSSHPYHLAVIVFRLSKLPVENGIHIRNRFMCSCFYFFCSLFGLAFYVCVLLIFL